MKQLPEIRTFIVYCHTNKVNGKKYIGITAQTLEQRCRANGNGYMSANQRVFFSAIKKYGWDNFDHEILADGLSQEEAKQKEIELIAEFHTYIGDPDCNGYNMTRGGEGSYKYETEEERYQADRENNRKHQRKRRLDQEKHKKDLATSRQWYQEIKQDPVKYRAYLDKQKAFCRKADKENPEHYAKHLARNADYAKRVRAMRATLRELYETSPEVFTEEEHSKIYDKKPNTRHYCCENLSVLTAIYSSKLNV